MSQSPLDAASNYSSPGSLLEQSHIEMGFTSWCCHIAWRPVLTNMKKDVTDISNL